MLKKSLTEIGTNKRGNLNRRHINVWDAYVVSTVSIGFLYTKERVPHGIFLIKIV
jgi:hypothetical protein